MAAGPLDSSLERTIGLSRAEITLLCDTFGSRSGSNWLCSVITEKPWKWAVSVGRDNPPTWSLEIAHLWEYLQLKLSGNLDPNVLLGGDRRCSPVMVAQDRIKPRFLSDEMTSVMKPTSRIPHTLKDGRT